MGQLDILAAQSVATERQRQLARELDHRRSAAERAPATSGRVRPARRRYGLTEWLHLVHHPAR